MYNKRTLLIDHIREHATIYIFMTILFLTGVIFGAIIVNSMNFVQKQDLFFYLERFFGDIADDGKINSSDVLQSSFLYHVKYLFMLFILGLSVIGLPVVWILLFLKGLVVGFSVGFIVNQLGLDGLFLAALSIAPQNLLIIPVYIVAGSLSMLFSLTLLRKLFARRISQPVLQPLGRYATVFASLMVFSLAAAALEAYVANGAMEMLIQSLYNE
ncbi:stage II sporulation protein M [Lentibacillus sp. CBA3610]|uniref:stage II sporulation protein M n=1 Tax=Lentibacillus sp. CBA3610 TaxID=2518176 RepID=UPI0015954F9C|nr:stage II sporulation protein M [Lentibacillus sp. CBA3610]QKY69254.1 stage II sporulation protein M [Lentibacillus sp. CBA3610]